MDLRDDDAVAEWAALLEGDDGTTDFYDVIVFVAAGGANAKTGHDDVPAWEVPREDFVVAYEREVGGLSNVVRHLVPRMMMSRRRTDCATTTTGAAEGEHDGGVCGGVPSWSCRRYRRTRVVATSRDTRRRARSMDCLGAWRRRCPIPTAVTLILKKNAANFILRSL